MCDTRRYGLLDGNALVGRSRYEQSLDAFASPIFLCFSIFETRSLS